MTTMSHTDELIRRLWKVEEQSVEKSENSDDKHCEEFFKKNHTRDSFGRNSVGLPFKSQTDFSDGVEAF